MDNLEIKTNDTPKWETFEINDGMISLIHFLITFVIFKLFYFLKMPVAQLFHVCFVCYILNYLS